MKKAEFIVHVWLDVKNTILGISRQPFMNNVRSPQWTIHRMRLFQNFTLQSLLNQSDLDFRIFLFLDPDMKKIHNKFALHPKVERIYDDGKRMYTKEIDRSHAFVFRTDSDDLLHKDCIAIMKHLAVYENYRTCNVLHRVYQWNTYHKFTSEFVLPRSPFTAHTFPRSIYSDWSRMKVEQFMDYKSCPHTVRERLICIVRHGRNVTFPRIKKDMRAEIYFINEKRKRNNLTTNKNAMKKLLKNFGIREDQVK